MTPQLAEQIRKSGIVDSPIGAPKGTEVRIGPPPLRTRRTDIKPISTAEAAFRSVMMSFVATAPIADRQSFDQADAILESGKAALHERAVSTFSATLEQTANSIPAEYMLEQVTRAVQEYEQKHDPAWVDTPEETVRRAAEARGYNPAEINGGRSEILLRDLEKLKLAMEEGKNVTSFEILQTFIFQTLGRYETTDGRIVAVWQDGEREYSSTQDAWEDIFTTQTLRNLMNETLTTLAGSNMAVSDPAAPASGTEDPTTSPELDPTNPPTPTDELPPPSPTPDLSTPEPIPPEQDSIDISNEAHQVIIIDGTTFSDKYTYVNPTTMVPPDGKTMDGGRQVFLDNANTQRDVLKRQGLTPGITTVHVRPDELINTVVTFDPEGRVMYVPSITVNGKVFFSSSTSKAFFDVDIPEGTRAQYKAISLPADTDPATVTVRHRGEADIVELTDKFGNQWVWDFRKGEFVSMIDRPATAEMRAALPDYVAAYARTADAEHAELFSSVDVVIERLTEDVDGKGNKVLIDKDTGVPLFIKLQNEDGSWDWQKPTLNYFSEQLNITFGTDTVAGPTSRDKELYTLYGSGTVVVGMEWWRVEPERGVIDPWQLSEAKKVFNELEEAGIDKININAILFSYPDWLKTGEFSQEELREIMRNRIAYVIRNTPEASSYEVVNEPYDLNNPDRQNDPFYRAWGGFDYIIEAYRIARETANEMGRPDVALIFNDMDNHRANGGTTQATREIIDMLLAEGLVDFVGMQMHFNQWGGVTNGKLDPSIQREIEYYKGKVPVLITELTYTPTDRELAMSESDLNKRLSQIFASVVQVAIESENVQGITTWGLTEQYLEGTGWKQLFDEKAQPRPAFYEVMRVLFEATKK